MKNLGYDTDARIYIIGNDTSKSTQLTTLLQTLRPDNQTIYEGLE